MLLLSTEPRFVFVHIPKNAGTAFSQAAKNGHCIDHGLKTHTTLDQVLEHYPQFHGAPVIAIFRNPWARLWSLYNFSLNSALERMEDRYNGTAKRSHHLDRDRRFIAKARGFGFSEWILRSQPVDGHNTRPQLSFAGSPHLIPLRFEQLETDIRRTSVIADVQIQHIRPTAYPDPNYRPHYTKKARELVAEIYRPDIERFGYSFD